MKKLTKEEVNARCVELAEHIGLLQEAKERKATLTAQVNKDIKFQNEIVLRVSQEINSGEVDDTQAEMFAR